ncbi:MAG TPA: hypothetical protein VK808_10055, partial [Bacteroidia bacterium]|nr:hypothetical protein [Bacteroidia bacterium]
MKKLLLLLSGLFIVSFSAQAGRGGKLALVPEPSSVVYLRTSFTLSDSVVIIAPDSCREASYFSDYV